MIVQVGKTKEPLSRATKEAVQQPSARRYPVVLFDLFHTLVDVGSAPGAAGRYTADILGLDRDTWNHACFSEAHDITRPTEHREVIRALAHSLDPSIDEARILEATAERQRRFDYALSAIDPLVLNTMNELRTMGCRLGLISNASSGEVSGWSNSPLAVLFEHALFSCECGLCKPQPAIYELALERFEISSRQAVFVGDGGSNEHRGAGAVGLFRILQRGYVGLRYSAEALQARVGETEAVIDSIAELPALLARLEMVAR